MRVSRHQLSYAQREIAEYKSLERQLRRGGMRILSERHGRLVDATSDAMADYRWRRRWAIQRARWAIRRLNAVAVAA